MKHVEEYVRLMLILMILIMIVLVCGCKSKEIEYDNDIQEIQCPDGRIVSDKKLCDIEDNFIMSIDSNLDVEPKYDKLLQTSIIVSSSEDAKDAFDAWVQHESLNYELYSVEYLEKSGYYMVIYKHSNGKRNVLITPDGTVLEQKIII